MPFLRLVFNLETLRKLAERGLSVDDVTEVFRTASVVTVPNPTRVPQAASGPSDRPATDTS